MILTEAKILSEMEKGNIIIAPFRKVRWVPTPTMSISGHF